MIFQGLLSVSCADTLIEEVPHQYLGEFDVVDPQSSIHLSEDEQASTNEDESEVVDLHFFRTKEHNDDGESIASDCSDCSVGEGPCLRTRHYRKGGKYRCDPWFNFCREHSHNPEEEGDVPCDSWERLSYWDDLAGHREAGMGCEQRSNFLWQDYDRAWNQWDWGVFHRRKREKEQAREAAKERAVLAKIEIAKQDEIEYMRNYG